MTRIINSAQRPLLWVALAASLLTGCSFQRDVAGPVSDPDFDWVRAGFSVKAPPGRNWVQQETAKNAVVFQKAEGLAWGAFTNPNVIYVKGEQAVAAGVTLGAPIGDLSNKGELAGRLRTVLDQLLLGRKEKVSAAAYDTSLGTDCLKYEAGSNGERIPTSFGEMHASGIEGYLCMHPDHNDYLVLMQAENFATVWTEIPKKKDMSAFFLSLAFRPVSSSTIRRLGGQSPSKPAKSGGAA